MSRSYIDLTAALNRPRLMAPWADAPAVAARQRELERRWAAAAVAVCALGLLAVLIYGAAAWMKERAGTGRDGIVIPSYGVACAADARPEDYPEAWVE